MDMQTRQDGWLKASERSGTSVLRAGGTWEIAQLRTLASTLDASVARILARKPARTEIDLSELTSLDSGGAWLLLSASRQLRGRTVDVAFTGVQPGHAGLLDRVEQSTEVLARRQRQPHPHPLLTGLATIGAAAIGLARKGTELLGFFGLALTKIALELLQPWRIPFRSVAKHVETTGFTALPIVGLLAFLIGTVVAFMGSVQLKKFGAEIYTVDLLGIAILRELGVLITAILIAGRSGSSFTAQIGTMKVNQEIDAMRTIGLDPMRVLVLPRVFAMMITLPLLTLYANLVGLAGGAVVSMVALDITLQAFIDQLSGAITLQTFLIGFLKAPVFAFVIALVGCFEGMQVTGSAESVGHRTTQSVVEAIFLVIALDAAVAICLSIVGI